MKLDEKEEKYVLRMKKQLQNWRIGKWVAISIVAFLSYWTVIYRDKYGFEGFIIIEFWLLAAIIIGLLMRRDQKKLLSIIDKLKEPEPTASPEHGASASLRV